MEENNEEIIETESGAVVPKEELEGVEPESAVEEEETQFSTVDEILPYVEALFFAFGEPLAANKIAEILHCQAELVNGAIEQLVLKYEDATCGIHLVEVAEKFQMRTKLAYSSYIRELKAGKPRRLTKQALETLAIIAYRQPIVKSDIEKIRGVDASPTMKTLVERDLIAIVGHQGSVGQPALYGTTEGFLKLFGLKSLAELPTLRDIQELEEDPGEIEELEQGIQ